MNKLPMIIVILSILVLALSFPANIQIESYSVTWNFWYLDDLINIFAQFVSYTFAIIKYLFIVSFYVMQESPSIFKLPLLGLFSIILLTAVSVIVNIWKSAQ